MVVFLFFYIAVKELVFDIIMTLANIDEGEWVINTTIYRLLFKTKFYITNIS